MSRKFTDGEKLRIRRLRAFGTSWIDVAREFACTPRQVANAIEMPAPKWKRRAQTFKDAYGPVGRRALIEPLKAPSIPDNVLADRDRRMGSDRPTFGDPVPGRSAFDQMDEATRDKLCGRSPSLQTISN